MTTDSITIHAPISAGFEQILTPEALAFITELQRRFDGRRRELLQRRADRQIAIDAGQLPDFLPETNSGRFQLKFVLGRNASYSIDDKRLSWTWQNTLPDRGEVSYNQSP